MTSCVRFCLSYDCFNSDFIAIEVEIVSVENITLSQTASWCYMAVTKCYIVYGYTIFITWRYATV